MAAESMSDWADDAAAEITPYFTPLLPASSPRVREEARLFVPKMTREELTEERVGEYIAYAEATSREWVEATRKRNAEIMRRHLGRL